MRTVPSRNLEFVPALIDYRYKRAQDYCSDLRFRQGAKSNPSISLLLQADTIRWLPPGQSQRTTVG